MPLFRLKLPIKHYKLFHSVQQSRVRRERQNIILVRGKGKSPSSAKELKNALVLECHGLRMNECERVYRRRGMEGRTRKYFLVERYNVVWSRISVGGENRFALRTGDLLDC